MTTRRKPCSCGATEPHYGDPHRCSWYNGSDPQAPAAAFDDRAHFEAMNKLLDTPLRDVLVGIGKILNLGRKR